MDLRRGTVSPLNIPAWRDFPLRARLEALTGLAVALDNDAKALALAEGWTGAARRRRDFLAMVVSTGVGGGIVVDGRLLDGASGNAGHVGHVIVEPDGRLCRCGARGCLEAEASGTAIAAATGRPPAEATPDVVSRTGRLVGRAVASVVSLLDIELIVVGGSVALGFGAPFFAAANDELHARARLSFTARRAHRPERAGRRRALSWVPARWAGEPLIEAWWRPRERARHRPGTRPDSGPAIAAVAVGAGPAPVVVARRRWPRRRAWRGRVGGTGGRRARARRGAVAVPDGDRLRRIGRGRARRPRTWCRSSAGAAPWGAGAGT